MPFWTYFPVQEALHSFDSYLSVTPYDRASVTMFQHGVESAGLASAADFERVVRSRGTCFDLIAVDPDKSPHDIGSMTRYGPELQAVPDAGLRWELLDPLVAAHGLRTLTYDSTR